MTLRQSPPVPASPRPQPAVTNSQLDRSVDQDVLNCRCARALVLCRFAPLSGASTGWAYGRVGGGQGNEEVEGVRAIADPAVVGQGQPGDGKGGLHLGQGA